MAKEQPRMDNSGAEGLAAGAGSTDKTERPAKLLSSASGRNLDLWLPDARLRTSRSIILGSRMKNIVATRISYAARRLGWILLTILSITLILLGCAVIGVAGRFGKLWRRDVVDDRVATKNNL